jgi:hypothetical protein
MVVWGTWHGIVWPLAIGRWLNPLPLLLILCIYIESSKKKKPARRGKRGGGGRKKAQATTDLIQNEDMDDVEEGNDNDQDQGGMVPADTTMLKVQPTDLSESTTAPSAKKDKSKYYSEAQQETYEFFQSQSQEPPPQPEFGVVEPDTFQYFTSILPVLNGLLAHYYPTHDATNTLGEDQDDTPTESAQTLSSSILASFETDEGQHPPLHSHSHSHSIY